MNYKEFHKEIKRINEKLKTDKETIGMTRKFQLKYGCLSEEDLNRHVTI